MEKIKKLYFVTEGYKEDYMFFQTELEKLVLNYEVVFISEGDDVPKEQVSKRYTYKNELTLREKIFCSISYFLKQETYQELKNILVKGASFWNKIGMLRESIEYYARAEKFYKWLKKNHVLDDKPAIFYTYWNNYYSLPPVFHKKEFSNCVLISRFHGFDLYDERKKYGYQPFKNKINEVYDKLIFASEYAKNYYCNKYANLDKNKAITSRLGTKSINIKTNHKEKEDFLIVSCSNLVPLKRVNLIVSAISLLKDNIKWVHFGDGPEMSQIERLSYELLSLKENVKYELKGYTENELIRQYYIDNCVDCFITTTSSEGGCPVSIQEAMSAGVIIIGTDVGDIPFMIEGNGVMLSENPSITEIAEAINNVINCDEVEREKMSHNSYNKWKRYFNSDINSNFFIERILH